MIIPRWTECDHNNKSFPTDIHCVNVAGGFVRCVASNGGKLRQASEWGDGEADVRAAVGEILLPLPRISTSVGTTGERQRV